ncbi:hypothetical protein SDC9_63170 [bioreactor metagenome]|uniref:Uncharacterized protein n=1 Tax=bioreactor metagenome TaxID=1076179 RepID=A0A644XM20_9ZZZZ
MYLNDLKILSAIDFDFISNVLIFSFFLRRVVYSPIVPNGQIYPQNSLLKSIIPTASATPIIIWVIVMLQARDPFTR